jgi:hypothetical protein
MYLADLRNDRSEMSAFVCRSTDRILLLVTVHHSEVRKTRIFHYTLI